MTNLTNRNTTRRLTLAALTLAALAGAAMVGTSNTSVAQRGGPDAYANLPSTLTLNATIRDFKAKGTTGGHNDFQAYTGSTTVGLVKTELGSDGKPVSASLRGQTIGTQFKDAQNRQIMPALFDAKLGDKKGTLSNGGTGNGLYSAESLNQWFRDTPGVNMTKVLPLTLTRVANTNRYLFDSATQEPWKTRGGFFPINGELYGNYEGGKNFHFTTEVETEFVYERGTGQVFTFSGDDDVWVFVGGKMVIDLGGLHSRAEQTIDLDRLSWLEDGKTYTLKIFHAERRTTQSNFRVETTLRLRAVQPPVSTGVFD